MIHFEFVTAGEVEENHKDVTRNIEQKCSDRMMSGLRNLSGCWWISVM